MSVVEAGSSRRNQPYLGGRKSFAFTHCGSLWFFVAVGSVENRLCG